MFSDKITFSEFEILTRAELLYNLYGYTSGLHLFFDSVPASNALKSNMAANVQFQDLARI